MPSAPTFQNATERTRYEALIDGEVAGISTYHDVGNRRVIVHTKVEDIRRGQGLATRLIEFALEDIRDSGLVLVPRCPMVAAYVDQHPEWADLVGELGR